MITFNSSSYCYGTAQFKLDARMQQTRVHSIDYFKVFSQTRVLLACVL